MQFHAYNFTERSPIRIRCIIQSTDAFGAGAWARSVGAFCARPLAVFVLSHLERILEQRTPYDLPQSEPRLFQSLLGACPLRGHLGGELKMAGRKVHQWVGATAAQSPGEREVCNIVIVRCEEECLQRSTRLQPSERIML